MKINEPYNEITDSEANFIILLYDTIKRLVLDEQKITLVRLGYELNIKPSELSDYLFEIVRIVDKVEEEIR
jgi:hypothetical protein|tara:strand:+ start:641 stop:853 length:213 start_codon:yes stop_codon:yes gene_type:complete